MRSENQRRTVAVAMLLMIVTGVIAFGRRRAPEDPVGETDSAAELLLRHPLTLSVGSPQHASQGREAPSIGSRPLAPIPAERRLITLPPALDQITVHSASVPRSHSITRTHRIVEGDSLEQLAEQYLGSREQSIQLFQANRHILTRPDVLPLGKRIVIPSVQPKVPLSPFPAGRSMDLKPLKP